MKNIFNTKYFIMLAVMVLVSFGCFNLVSGSETNPFPDVKEDCWALKNVENLYAKGLVNGYEDGTFRGENKLRACEFIKMLVCYYDYSTGDKTEDVSKEDPWFKKYWTKAVGIGIIDGSKGEDDYNYELSREEAAFLMHNTLLNNVVRMNMTKDPEVKIDEFTDNSKIDDKYKEAVYTLVNTGIVNGYEDGSFMPKGILNRYESTKLIDVFMGKSVKLIHPKSNVANDIYTVGYDYEDDGIPGNGYKITFNVPRKTINIVEKNHSSAVDVPEGKYFYNIDWSNDEVWYKNVQDLFYKKYENDKRTFGRLCLYITWIGSQNTSEYSNSKASDWKDYEKYDSNKDGSVTKLEYANGVIESYFK